MQAFKFQAIKETDIDLIFQWLCKPHVAERWGGIPEYPKIRSKYLRYMISDYIFAFIISLHGKPIGYIHYYYANCVGQGWWPNSDPNTVGLDLYIGELEYISKGYGPRLLKQFIEEEIFTNTKINKIMIDVAPDNFRAQRCYSKLGFTLLGETDTPAGKAVIYALKKPEAKPLT
jgi:RimJ/RimL family protein N-acetyltransferase